MRNKIYNTLEGLGYPIGLQGSFDVKDIPDDVITYRIAASSDTRRYNNRPWMTGYSVEVNFYSTKMSLIDSVSAKISDAMLAAGFTREGPGYDAGYDKDTGHYGYMMDFYYIERKED